ncbi:MAG: hypothetical protein ACMXYK_05375 [Candidatus Woesearchaeota archaeon]
MNQNQYFDLRDNTQNLTPNLFYTLLEQAIHRSAPTSTNTNIQNVESWPTDSTKQTYNVGHSYDNETSLDESTLKNIKELSELIQDHTDAFAYILGMLQDPFSKINLEKTNTYFQANPIDLHKNIETADQTTKIFTYKINADTRFIHLTQGVESKVLKEHAITYYKYASALRSETFGRNDELGIVLYKMSENFQKYLDISQEIFQELMYNYGARSLDIGINKNATIDDLLEALHKAETIDQKNRIITRLKDIQQK